MGLVIIPLLIEHRDEIVMFNNFANEQNSLNQNNIVKLCKIFKEKKTVIPLFQTWFLYQNILQVMGIKLFNECSKEKYEKQS